MGRLRIKVCEQKPLTSTIIEVSYRCPYSNSSNAFDLAMQRTKIGVRSYRNSIKYTTAGA
jgi:hypothetical protein